MHWDPCSYFDTWYTWYTFGMIQEVGGEGHTSCAGFVLVHFLPLMSVPLMLLGSEKSTPGPLFCGELQGWVLLYCIDAVNVLSWCLDTVGIWIGNNWLQLNPGKRDWLRVGGNFYIWGFPQQICYINWRLFLDSVLSTPVQGLWLGKSLLNFVFCARYGPSLIGSPCFGHALVISYVDYCNVLHM